MKMLNIENLKDNIERWELVVRKPEWLGKMDTKRKEHAPGPDDRGKRGRGGKTVHNGDQDHTLMLQRNKRYAAVFHPRNKRALDPLKHNNGEDWCLNWHFSGFCTGDCYRRASHTKRLTAPEKQRGRQYLHQLRQLRERATANHGRQHQGQGTPREEPSQREQLPDAPLFGPGSPNGVPPPPTHPSKRNRGTHARNGNVPAASSW